MASMATIYSDVPTCPLASSTMINCPAPFEAWFPLYMLPNFPTAGAPHSMKNYSFQHLVIDCRFLAISVTNQVAYSLSCGYCHSFSNSISYIIFGYLDDRNMAYC